MMLDKKSASVKIQITWMKMRGNASIKSNVPSFRNEYESRLFWVLLKDSIEFRMRELSDEIHDLYGFRFSFKQCGRQGGTIAPSEYFSIEHYEPLEMDYEKLSLLSDTDRSNLHLSFIHINKFWKNAANSVETWWGVQIKSNSMEDDISANDNTLLTCTLIQ